MKVAFASGIVGGIVLTILNTLLLVGIHKVLFRIPDFIIACYQLHFTFTQLTF